MRAIFLRAMDLVLRRQEPKGRRGDPVDALGVFGRGRGCAFAVAAAPPGDPVQGGGENQGVRGDRVQPQRGHGGRRHRAGMDRRQIWKGASFGESIVFFFC